MAGRLRLGLIALALSGCGGAQDSAPNGSEANAEAADNAEMPADNLAVDDAMEALDNSADAVRDVSDPANPEDPPGDSPEDPPGAR